MSDKHGLRTTGTHTGNFGRQKVQGKRESLDLSETILKKKDLRIPNPERAYELLEQAYNATTDLKLKQFLHEQLRSRRATRIAPSKYAKEVVQRDHWDEVKRTR